MLPSMTFIRNLILFGPMLFPVSVGLLSIFSRPESQTTASSPQQLSFNGLTTDQEQVVTDMVAQYRICNRNDANHISSIDKLTITLNAEKKYISAKDGTISKLEVENAGVTKDLYTVLDATKDLQMAGRKIQRVAVQRGRDWVF